MPSAVGCATSFDIRGLCMSHQVLFAAVAQSIAPVTVKAGKSVEAMPKVSAGKGPWDMVL